MHWMLELGIQVWYYFKSKLWERIGSVIARHCRNVKDYYEEFRILSIYANSCGARRVPLVSNPQEQNLEDLMCQWYISYRLG